ncbi:putative retrotransposon hot spot protein (RHS) [Trypanosoma cruzi]|uniref:Putative retrotransposon hot spot protein (RHS) n=1 Tax=Trypanosoma cruzi TaxID=5693 RepID=A0A2V2WLG0_TRYCR|nr:putative retrotransposon hot spot protein (RHS) [Trypanosoma cruzi]RNC34704.1 retrotransposon hot spot (RHS) protein [Trypanosoma cruzi]
MSSTVRDILLEGSNNRTNMRLNDFLRSNLGGTAAVGEDHNVTMQVFVRRPNDYVKNQRLLEEILNLTEYRELETIYKLRHEGVVSLGRWRDYEGKDTVTPYARGKLNAALEDVRQTSTPVVISKVLKGMYESVHNASWHHVVEVPGGEGTEMEAKEGEPPQSCTYKKVGRTLEKDDGVQQSGEVPPRLMVLTSEKGWPYSWNAPHRAGNDLCVNSEVERVWQIIRNDLTKGSAILI